MRGQVRDAAHRVTLDLDIGAQHLADERLETAQLDDEEFVIGCKYYE